MTYKESIAAISHRELKHMPATAPAGMSTAYDQKGGLAYGMLYLAGVFGFSIWMSQAKMGGKR